VATSCAGRETEGTHPGCARKLIRAAGNYSVWVRGVKKARFCCAVSMREPVFGGPCINSRRPRARLRRSGHRAYSLCRCLRGVGGGRGRHRGWPGFGIASRSPCRVDRIARRRLPCAKRASLLSCAPRHQIEQFVRRQRLIVKGASASSVCAR